MMWAEKGVNCLAHHKNVCVCVCVCVFIMVAFESDSCCRKVILCFELCTLNHGMRLLELTGWSSLASILRYPFYVCVGVPF